MVEVCVCVCVRERLLQVFLQAVEIGKPDAAEKRINELFQVTYAPKARPDLFAWAQQSSENPAQDPFAPIVYHISDAHAGYVFGLRCVLTRSTLLSPIPPGSCTYSFRACEMKAALTPANTHLTPAGAGDRTLSRSKPMCTTPTSAPGQRGLGPHPSLLALEVLSYRSNLL